MEKKWIKLIFTFFFCTIMMCGFYGCALEFDEGDGTMVTVSGNVKLDGAAMENVEIRCAQKIFCYSNASGAFTFSTKMNNIYVYAEKSGYAFDGRFKLEDSSVSNVVFNAKQVQNLTGTIKLNSIDIVPTSINSLYDNNFAFNNEGKQAIKITCFDLDVDSTNINIIDTATFANKNETCVLDCLGKNISLQISPELTSLVKFKIQCAVTMNQQETSFSSDNWISITIAKLTSANLIDTNKIEFSLYGINSASNGFTYSICLKFDYTPA